MRKKIVIAVLVAAALGSTALVGCGNDESATSDISTTESESGSATSTDPMDVLIEEGEHDATEKENSFAADLAAALEAESGSLDTVLGSYSIMNNGEAVENIYYVIDEDSLSIVETGAYEFNEDGTVTISYGTNDAGTTYDITETTDGFALTTDENVYIPLIYMEGTDGLLGTDVFDGIYAVSDNYAFIFNADGTLDVLTTQECKVKKKTITIAGAEYDWVENDGNIELSTNGTVVMTLKPAE